MKKANFTRITNKSRKNESEIGKSMSYRLNAEYQAFVENEEDYAIQLINQAIEKFNDDIYPLFTKFSICERFNRIQDMENVIEILEGEIGKGSRFYKIF
ncbi:hypothetical protein KQR57_04085 [Bacillus inaquosorum]|nr:hypothetical protein [Bacillus inaquosorum]